MNKIALRIYSILPKNLKSFWVKIASSEIGIRIAKGAFWSLSGSVISQGLMLLASIMVARILGKTEYGELGMIRSTVNMFAVFAGFGLGITATKYVAELQKKDKIRTGKIIGLSTLLAAGIGVIIATVLLIMAPVIATKTINAPELVNEIRLSAIMLFFSAINGAQTGILAGYEAFKVIAKINFITGICAFPIQIGFTLIFGLPGSVIGFGLNFVLLWILNYFAVRKESKSAGVIVNYRESWSEWPIIYKFSLPALLGGILVGPVMWVCNTMLVNKPHGYEEMAIFDAANQWRNAILFIPAVLSQIVLPLLSSSAHSQKQFNSILKVNILINFVISIIMAIFISILAPFIMRTYGNGFTEGRTVLIVLAFSTVMVSINNVVGQAIAGIGRMWIGFAFNFIWGIILFSSSYLFLNLGYGAMGLAYAFLISYFSHTLIQFIFFYMHIYKKKDVFFIE